MKYHELLDKIYWHWRRDNRGADGLQPMVDYRRALLAVMELHKPTNDGMCGKCLGLASDWVTYPCSTVQVIEKELQ